MLASHHPIEDYLLDRELVSPEQIAEARERAAPEGLTLVTALAELGHVEKNALLVQIATDLGCEYVRELPETLPAELVAIVPSEVARRLGVVPFRGTERGIDVLALDPFNGLAFDELAFLTEREIGVMVADPRAVQAAIERHYGFDAAASPEAGGDLAVNDDVSRSELEALAEWEPVVRFVNLVLAQAIRDRASDIHFEPFEEEFKIRYRIDGALHEMAPPPKSLALPVASRLKVLAHLDIAERRVPQDGRMRLTLGGRPVDLRVSTLPTQFGESIVLRVLDQSAVQLEMAQLGLPADVLERMQTTIRRPNGIFVVTGPTGSGKTTTLYSGLRAINSPELKILTAEDPVEYEIEGIMQMAVNPTIGLTFASALRSFLRQDPDVVMVGEIRDEETAQIAIQASLTGHLVFTTLHTNDAVGAVTRLLDLGVEPFLVASSLEAVLAQRLVRRICRACRVEYVPAPEVLEQCGVPAALVAGRPFFRGEGCAQCAQTGYQGRMGIFEWLPVSESIRDLVTRKAPTLLLRQQAIDEGMRTLRDDGLRAVLNGDTTIDEVARYT